MPFFFSLAVLLKERQRENQGKKDYLSVYIPLFSLSLSQGRREREDANARCFQKREGEKKRARERANKRASFIVCPISTAILLLPSFSPSFDSKVRRNAESSAMNKNCYRAELESGRTKVGRRALEGKERGVQVVGEVDEPIAAFFPLSIQLIKLLIPRSQAPCSPHLEPKSSACCQAALAGRCRG